MYSALDALNSLTGSYLVKFVHTIDVFVVSCCDSVDGSNCPKVPEQRFPHGPQAGRVCVFSADIALSVRAVGLGLQRRGLREASRPSGADPGNPNEVP